MTIKEINKVKEYIKNGFEAVEPTFGTFKQDGQEKAFPLSCYSELAIKNALNEIMIGLNSFVDETNDYVSILEKELDETNDYVDILEKELNEMNDYVDILEKDKQLDQKQTKDRPKKNQKIKFDFEGAYAITPECKKLIMHNGEWNVIDNVNNPQHYTKGSIQPIDYILDHDMNFNIGNVIKYVSRAKYKGNELEDLKKAKWYLEKEIGRITPKEE